MEELRFEKFTLLIDGIHKSIHKLKLDNAPSFGVKGVHIFWVYELSRHPEGLTAAEIATAGRIDRSLVSREIEALKDGGYIASRGGTGSRRYNERFFLTDTGKELSERIIGEIVIIQNAVNRGVDEGELEIFYSVLERLYGNFEEVLSHGETCQSKK